MKKDGYKKTIIIVGNDKLYVPDSQGEFQDFFCSYLNAQVKALGDAATYGEELSEKLIHDARVALRSLLSVCGSLKSWIEKSWYKDVIPRAKAAVKLLGKVRDADVLLTRLKGYADKQNPSGESIVLLEARIRETRTSAQAEVLEYFLSEQHRILLRNLACGTACMPAIDKNYKVVPSKMKEVWSVSAYNAAQSLLAYDAYLHGDCVSAELLHRMRISFKRLRYLAEFFQSVAGKNGEEIVKICVRCQDALGKMHDNTVAAQNTLQFSQLFLEMESKSKEPDLCRYIAFCSGEAEKYARIFLRDWQQEGEKKIRSLTYNM